MSLFEGWFPKAAAMVVAASLSTGVAFAGHGGGGHGGGHGGHPGGHMGGHPGGHPGGYGHHGGYVHHGGYGGRGYGYGGLGLLGYGLYGGGYGYGGYGYGGSGYGGYASNPAYVTQSVPARSSTPYLTDQTYEPGDGYRYPLYYDPATGRYIYYPVAR